MSSPGSQQLTDEAPGVILSLLRYWRAALLLVLVFAALAFGVSLLLPEQYAASAELGLTDPRGSNIFITAGGALPQDLERYTAKQESLVESVPTFERTQDILDWDVSVDQLFEHIGVSSDVPGVITIHATARTASQAQELANAVSTAYGANSRQTVQNEATRAIAAIDASRRDVIDQVEKAQEARDEDPGNPLLQRQLDATVESLNSLNQRVAEIQVNAAAFDDGVEYALGARRPEQPSEPQPLRNTMIAAILGLVVAGVVSWIRADRHRAADEEDAPEAVLGAPMLGAVPELAGGASLQYVFRSGVILVTSPARGDGKTVSAVSIAAVAARDGSRVVLVDGDARSSGLTRRLLGSTGRGERGLTDLADGDLGWDVVAHPLLLRDDVMLPFVPSGADATNLAGLFRRRGMAEAMASLRESYDLVVIDCPALLAVADVATLAAHADGIVLVVSRGTPLRSLEAVSQRLELVPAPLVGYVFTRADAQQREASYGTRVQLPWHLVRGGRRSQERRRRDRGDEAVATTVQEGPAPAAKSNGSSSRRGGGWGRRRRSPAGSSRPQGEAG
jgi:Mrp family chromosome partitioning ATPase